MSICPLTPATCRAPKKRHAASFLSNVDRIQSVDKFLDEYYSLDFDDIVAGMPTRFRFRQVPANDFGLSAEEVARFGLIVH